MARRPNLWPAAKSVARRPNLWHRCPICDTASKSVALWPNLWHCGQICGMAAKSLTRRPNLWHCGQICSTAAKSVARRPNLWHGSQIWKQNRKCVYKITKNSNTYCLSCLREAKHKLNRNNKDVRIVYAKCVLQKSFPATFTISFQRASSISHYSSEQNQPKHFQKKFSTWRIYKLY